jgi:hypothetical protein
MVADARTTLALYVGAIPGTVLLVLIAFHVYARWTIRNIDRTDDH